MAWLLHIETATDVCSVAISKDDQLIHLQESVEPYVHGARINLLIQQCLESSNIKLDTLNAISVSSGPGSYTALRIGTATAKGLCYGLGIPLISVDTLASLASSIQTNASIPIYYIPMIDARRMEVYHAIFDENMQLIRPAEALIVDGNSFDQMRQMGRRLVLMGNGAEKCREVLYGPDIEYRESLCSARHLITLAFQQFSEGNFVDVAYYSPFYLKPPNITLSKKKL